MVPTTPIADLPPADALSPAQELVHTSSPPHRYVVANMLRGGFFLCSSSLVSSLLTTMIPFLCCLFTGPLRLRY